MRHCLRHLVIFPISFTNSGTCGLFFSFFALIFPSMSWKMCSSLVFIFIVIVTIWFYYYHTYGFIIIVVMIIIHMMILLLVVWNQWFGVWITHLSTARRTARGVKKKRWPMDIQCDSPQSSNIGARNRKYWAAWGDKDLGAQAPPVGADARCQKYSGNLQVAAINVTMAADTSCCNFYCSIMLHGAET